MSKDTMNDTPSQALVSPSDIADMAGVSRGAVSNWRKRADDFPEAVGGTAAKPLFSREAVRAWLVSRGYEVKKDSSEARVWSAMNTLRGPLAPHAMADLVLTLACARKLSDEAEYLNPLWFQIRDRVHERGFGGLDEVAENEAERDPRWSTLVDSQGAYSPYMDIAPAMAEAVVQAFDRVDTAELARISDYVLAKLARAQVRSGLEHGFVESRISEALGNLAAAQGGRVLYDPACGSGTALLTAIGAGLTPERAIGHDINHGALRQAAQRAYLRDVDIELVRGDVLAHDLDEGLRADIVIAEPPYSMKLLSVDVADSRWEFGTPVRRSSEVAWIQHVVAHLTDQGRGFVVTPLGVLFRGSGERAVRTELLRRGCVEAIIALPPKMLPHTGIPLAVWVLRSPSDDGRSHVLFVDASGVKDVEKRIGDWLPACDGVDIDVPHQRVDIRDLLAADGNLSPAQWIEVGVRPPAEVAETYRRSWKDLHQVLDEIKGAGDSLRHFAGTSGVRTVTIGDLLDQGLLEMRPGRTRQADLPGELQHRYVTPGQIRSGHIPAVDETVTISESLKSELTEDGDVLVSTHGTISAMVDPGGGHLLGYGTYRLRSTDIGQLSNAYLALVIPGSWNNRFMTGTGIPRADIRLLEVPLAPATEQAHAKLADTAVKLLTDQAHDLLTQTASLREAMRDALRYNITLPNAE